MQLKSRVRLGSKVEQALDDELQSAAELLKKEKTKKGFSSRSWIAKSTDRLVILGDLPAGIGLVNKSEATVCFAPPGSPYPEALPEGLRSLWSPAAWAAPRNGSWCKSRTRMAANRSKIHASRM
jgi:hypothetical protein